MSNWIIALFLACGASAWIYSKIMRTSGNNTRSSIITAAVSGVLIFFVTAIILGYVMGLTS